MGMKQIYEVGLDVVRVKESIENSNLPNDPKEKIFEFVPCKVLWKFALSGKSIAGISLQKIAGIKFITKERLLACGQWNI